jgi:hypothetical protein
MQRLVVVATVETVAMARAATVATAAMRAAAAATIANALFLMRETTGITMIARDDDA